MATNMVEIKKEEFWKLEDLIKEGIILCGEVHMVPSKGGKMYKDSKLKNWMYSTGSGFFFAEKSLLKFLR